MTIGELKKKVDEYVNVFGEDINVEAFIDDTAYNIVTVLCDDTDLTLYNY